MLKKYYVSAVFSLCLLTVLVRLYHINSPVADWHSWRQSDTAAVAVLYVKDGIDLLRPRYFDLSNIQSGKENPSGWRMVEFPLYQGIGASIVRLFPNLSIELVLRLISIAAQVGTVALLIYVGSSWYGHRVGLLSGFFFGILPYNIYYGRAILPEPLMVFLTLVSVSSLYHGVNKKKMWLFWIVVSAFSAALAILVKPVAVFFLLPLVSILAAGQLSLKQKMITICVVSITTLVPFIWWRSWISRFPEGIPVYLWLLNEGNIRFKGAWFYWLFAQRLGNLILGYWGLAPFVIGLSLRDKKHFWILSAFVLSVLLYFVVFAKGNIQHDYYQIPIIPALCVILARGFVWMSTTEESRWSFKCMAIVSFLFMMGFSWYTIRTFYWINRPEIVEAGIVADSLLPNSSKVIAPYNGDTTFLYQINRQGWPLGFDIDKKIASGATHYVTVSPTDDDFETKELAEKYTVLVRNDKFAIIDLTRKK